MSDLHAANKARVTAVGMRTGSPHRMDCRTVRSALAIARRIARMRAANERAIKVDADIAVTRRTDALVEFISARLDEEEHDAQIGGGTSPRWQSQPADDPRRVVGYGDTISTIVPQCTSGTAAHIARQDPAATLARVEALRALTSQLAGAASLNLKNGLEDDLEDYLIRAVGSDGLRHLAAVWAYHPDYRWEWDKPPFPGKGGRYDSMLRRATGRRSPFPGKGRFDG